MKNNTRAKLLLKNILMTVMLPVLFFVVFTVITGGTFASRSIIQTILRSSVFPCLLCMAMSLNMSTGMWDFSCGATLYMAAILGGNLAKAFGAGILGMAAVIVVFGVVIGAVTGLLYNLFKVPSIVLTIGLCMVYEGIPRIFFPGGVQISRSLGVLSYAPWCFVVLALAFALFYFVMQYTVFGHNLSIIGANQDVAYRSGIDIKKSKFLSFTLAGLLLGVAAVLYLGQTGNISCAVNLSSVGLIYDAMMGFFVGSFLSKYCGLPIGIIAGIFSIRILNTGLVASGLSSTVNQIFTGALLLLLLIISSNQGLLDSIKTRRETAKTADAQWKQRQA